MGIYWDIQCFRWTQHYLGSRRGRDAGFGFNAVAIDLCTVHLSFREGASDLHSVLDETTQIICHRPSYCCFPLSGEFGLIPGCSQMDVARQHGWGPLLPAIACICKPTRRQGHTYVHTCASELLWMSGLLHECEEYWGTCFKGCVWETEEFLFRGEGKSGHHYCDLGHISFLKKVVLHSACWNQHRDTAISNMINVCYVRPQIFNSQRKRE